MSFLFTCLVAWWWGYGGIVTRLVDKRVGGAAMEGMATENELDFLRTSGVGGPQEGLFAVIKISPSMTAYRDTLFKLVCISVLRANAYVSEPLRGRIVFL